MAEVLARHAKPNTEEALVPKSPAEHPDMNRGSASAGAPGPLAKIPDVKHEMWLATRLKAHGAEIFTGDTNPALRRDRFRKAIRDNLLGLVVVGQKDGKPIDYAAAFESLYGEPL